MLRWQQPSRLVSHRPLRRGAHGLPWWNGGGDLSATSAAVASSSSGRRAGGSGGTGDHRSGLRPHGHALAEARARASGFRAVPPHVRGARPSRTSSGWEAAARGEAVDWDEVFRGYRAQVDWPGARYWRDLARHFPKAKVILTVRDPDAWFDSLQATIAPIIAGAGTHPSPHLNAIAELGHGSSRPKSSTGGCRTAAMPRRYSGTISPMVQSEIPADAPAHFRSARRVAAALRVPRRRGARNSVPQDQFLEELRRVRSGSRVGTGCRTT